MQASKMVLLLEKKDKRKGIYEIYGMVFYALFEGIYKNARGPQHCLESNL